MRIVKDLTGTNRKITVDVGITYEFKNDYAEVDDKYIHHFEFYPSFEILPKGTKLPEEPKQKPLDVKEKK